MNTSTISLMNSENTVDAKAQHPTPSTQQAERSWLKTRARSESVLVNFPETDKG
jgi:hypothetical protein